MSSTYQQLCSNLEQLKLVAMMEHLEEVSDFVTNNSISFTEGLLKLSNYQIDYKSVSAARAMVKVATFPFLKELKDYDFDFQPSVNQQ